MARRIIQTFKANQGMGIYDVTYTYKMSWQHTDFLAVKWLHLDDRNVLTIISEMSVYKNTKKPEISLSLYFSRVY